AHCAVAADHDERIDPVTFQCTDDLADTARERVAAARCTQDRAAQTLDPHRPPVVEHLDPVPLQQGPETFTQADDLVAALVCRSRRRPDDGVESRRITAGRADRYPHESPSLLLAVAPAHGS